MLGLVRWAGVQPTADNKSHGSKPTWQETGAHGDSEGVLSVAWNIKLGAREQEMSLCGGEELYSGAGCCSVGRRGSQKASEKGSHQRLDCFLLWRAPAPCGRGSWGNQVEKEASYTHMPRFASTSPASASASPQDSGRHNSEDRA